MKRSSAHHNVRAVLRGATRHTHHTILRIDQYLTRTFGILESLPDRATKGSAPRNDIGSVIAVCRYRFNCERSGSIRPNPERADSKRNQLCRYRGSGSIAQSKGARASETFDKSINHCVLIVYPSYSHNYSSIMGFKYGHAAGIIFG